MRLFWNLIRHMTYLGLDASNATWSIENMGGCFKKCQFKETLDYLSGLWFWFDWDHHIFRNLEGLSFQ